MAADRRRPERERDQAADERHDDAELGRPEVEGGVGHGAAGLAVEHGRDQAQRVHRREHHRERAERAVGPALLEDAREHEELTREVGRERHREREHPVGDQHGREQRPPARHPAEPVELTGRRAPLHHRGEQEQRRRDEPVVDRLEDRAVEAEVVRREEAERDQPHLGEARVGDHPAHVGRAEGEQRAVEEPDRRQHEDRHAEVVHRLRELRDHDPQEPVDRRLRDDAREHRGDLGRRLAVGVRQPAVQREERRLDRERDREAEEDPGVRARLDLVEVEGALVEAVHDQRGQHQQRADHRVDHELDRRRATARPAPDADQHVERDQHHLEEGVEEQQVLRGEDADHGAGEEEHQPEVGARPLAAGPEGVRDRGGHHDHREPREPEREGVEPDRVRDAEARDPVGLLGELELRAAEVEAEQRVDPEPDLDEADEQRERAGRVARERQDPDRERGRDREPDQHRREHQRTATKTTRRTARLAAIANT